MNTNRPANIDKIHLKAIYWGIVLDLLVPAILVAVGLFLKSKDILPSPISNLQLLLIILLVVSIGEVIVIYIFKKHLLKSVLSSGTLSGEIDPEQIFVRYSIIIFSMSLAPSIYGFVYLLLGGTMEWFLLFVVITLLYFMLFKPKTEEIKKLFNQPDIQSNRGDGSGLKT